MIDYVSFNGILDDYNPEVNKTESMLALNLDEVATNLTYPIALLVDGLIRGPGVSITALSDNVVTLLDAQSMDTGFQFTCQNFNPTKFSLKTQIGIPPVIGADGIIYGVYERLDIAPIDITPPNENMQWDHGGRHPAGCERLLHFAECRVKKAADLHQLLIDISDLYRTTLAMPPLHR